MNILILNCHQHYAFSEGKLSQTLVERMKVQLEAMGHAVRTVATSGEFAVETEVANHQWADTVILQIPVNWMGIPWSAKRYMDEVYTAGTAGAFCNNDGRTSEAPKKNYGNGGTLTGKTYMLSLTFNAPSEAFDDPSEYLFQGKSVDDLFFPQHMNFRFFGMTGLPTFACYDVLKNPEIEQDFERLSTHLNAVFEKNSVTDKELV
ncbi:NAD(P)H-dependent oxidoreductase [Pseudovibrio sp. JE062]|uniref:NAD(P)H-dependent oxidoreductase n=1 Tax=Pseudovibrio sp. JE062 TaxID=439495 RepID=UPI000186BFE3|nr:NAD(P)H-dependent oxidoreductase [Pseudovibrio sp. JE062]EEA91857.1 hypothetical protein PJE062_2404 [Pseudovibrio sp. JE062]